MLNGGWNSHTQLSPVRQIAISKHTGIKVLSGLSEACKHLREEVRILRLHRHGVRRAEQYSRQSGLRLHLGCGPKIKPGWVNIDLSSEADLTLDLRRPLPFKAGSCEAVYSEHFLEHLEFPNSADLFLSECRRVLQSRGEFSVGVPDTEWPLLEYAGVRNDHYFELAKKAWHPQWCQTPLEHINYHFRQDGEHKFAYDFRTLERALARAGFVDIHDRRFDPEIDSADRECGTLYVRAYAP